VWIFTGITTSSILPPLLKAPDKILQALTACGWFVKTLVDSLAVYTTNTFELCSPVAASSQGGLEGSLEGNSQVFLNFSNTMCVSDVGRRTLDLITPMSHLRQIVAILMGWLAYDVCRPAAVAVDILLYPLTDLNFAKAVHNVLNSILWVVLQVPIVTATRCKLFQQTDGIIMCIPDFEPAFQFLIEGLRKTGQTVDNWLDIIFLAVERVVSADAPVECAASPLSALESNAAEKQIQKLLFGSNFTTVTGLTETLFGMTDGVSIIYYSTAKLSMQSVVSKDAWPFPIDPRIGIAAVRYAPDSSMADAGDAPGQSATSTAMMGCRCDDVMPSLSGSSTLSETLMVVSCAIVEYGSLTPASDIPDPSGLLNNHTMPVLFQVDSTPSYMKCAETKISLESIRWPRRRFTSIPSSVAPTSSLLSMLKGNADQTNAMMDADAALWVQPFCGADNRPREVCLQTFAKASCFPYCLALRQSGTYNAAMKLYNAPDWMNRVHLFNRDCNALTARQHATLLGSQTASYLSSSFIGHSVLNTGLQNGMSSADSMTSANSVTNTLRTDWSGGSVHSAAASVASAANVECVNNPLVTSIVPKQTLLQSGAGDYGNAFFGSTLANGQPFIYAGDTILTAECQSLADLENITQAPACVVKVHRIYGSEDNQYTLVETNARLPAVGVAQTPQQAENFLFSSNVLRIPYSYTTNAWTHNPATATENAIFYAVNPYWQVFSAFIKYCNNPNALGVLQLSVTSSFAKITVHRVYPYVYCPPNQNPEGCYDGLTAGIVIPTSRRPVFDAQDCYVPMDIAVSSMEYINVENIAIQVVRATLADTNHTTLQPTNFTTVTYFLNTITMQIREDRAWNTEVPQAIVATQGQLCPALRRMPQLGSFATELLVAGIHFLKMPFNTLLNGVYIFGRWSNSGVDGNGHSNNKNNIQVCPLVTRGHTAVLRACGSNAFSLKDFFASMAKVNSILFGMLGLVSRALVGFQYSGHVRTFLNGIKIFGENQYDPMLSAVIGGKWTGGVLGNSPLHSSALNVLTSTLQLPAYVQAFKLGVSTLAMADFVWHFVVELIYRIVRANKGGITFSGTSSGTFSGTSSATSSTSPEAVFWTTMYDLKEELDGIVTKSLMQSCAGLSLTFGYTNPWAQFARYQCNAMSTVFSNLVDFLNTFLVSSFKILFTFIPNNHMVFMVIIFLENRKTQQGLHILCSILPHIVQSTECFLLLLSEQCHSRQGRQALLQVPMRQCTSSVLSYGSFPGVL
jgi:hypothetical protein